MIDTISFNLDVNNKKIDLQGEIPNYLHQITEHTTKTGDLFLRGYLHNPISEVGFKHDLLFDVYRNNLILRKGSICKWYVDTNLSELKREHLVDCFDAIGEYLHIPILDAKVTRLDIGANINLTSEPNLYLDSLGSCGRYKRLERSEQELKGVLYKQVNKELCIYDKIAEIQQNILDLPPQQRAIFKERKDTILRYELRYTHKVAQQLKRPGLLVSDLVDVDTWGYLLNNWVDTYKKIHKNNLLNFDNEMEASTLKEFDIIARLALVKLCGGENNFYKQLKAMYKNGKITRYNYNRIKNAMGATLQVRDKLIFTDDNITELTQKIEETKDRLL